MNYRRDGHAVTPVEIALMRGVRARAVICSHATTGVMFSHVEPAQNVHEPVAGRPQVE
jgi:hypothetical protein